MYCVISNKIRLLGIQKMTNKKSVVKISNTTSQNNFWHTMNWNSSSLVNWPIYNAWQLVNKSYFNLFKIIPNTNVKDNN